MARARRNSRPVHGLILLDKPTGMTSNRALQRVRQLFSAAKAGHAGVLDPLATGMLPVCLGEATKIAGLLLGKDKAYRTRVRLGVDTDTDDAEGEVIRQRPVPALERAALEAVLARFVGQIEQVPPRYSALKRDGVPLYKRARRGEQFEVPARRVEIHALRLLAHGADWLELDIECGSGTYVRSLARDIGEALGCGGHVEQLRRLWVEPFRDQPMRTLDALEALADSDPATLDACLLPIAAGLPDWPRVALDADAAARFQQGQRIRLENLPEGSVLACDAQGGLIGLAEGRAGLLVPQRVFVLAA